MDAWYSHLYINTAGASSGTVRVTVPTCVPLLVTPGNGSPASVKIQNGWPCALTWKTQTSPRETLMLGLLCPSIV
jgi:hypothetical protein